MKEKLINEIMTKMNMVLDSYQKDILLKTLTDCFDGVDVHCTENALSADRVDNSYYIDAFIAVKQLAGRQKSTLAMYRYEIRKFADITGCDLVRVDTNAIRRYLFNCQKKISNTSVDNIRRCLNSFYEFMSDEGYMLTNPVKKIAPIKSTQKIKKFFTDYQIEQLRDNCTDSRELALIDLLLSTGLRIHEVPKIKISDIDWEQRIIIIHGKGNKDRLVPFSIRAGKHMKDYIADRSQNSDYLFCRTRAPYNIQGTKAMVNDMFAKIRDRAGIKDITVHGIRRWVASTMNDRGADPAIIQEVLGHASFSTTQKHYLNKNYKRITQIHDICAV